MSFLSGYGDRPEKLSDLDLEVCWQSGRVDIRDLEDEPKEDVQGVLKMAQYYNITDATSITHYTK